MKTILWKESVHEKDYKLTGYFNDKMVSELYLSFLSVTKDVTLNGHYLDLELDEWMDIRYQIEKTSDIYDGIHFLKSEIERLFREKLFKVLD